MSVPDDLVGERVVTTPREMDDLGRRLGESLEAGDLVVLTGELGAGKTTLTRGIGAGLGIRGPVQSPTFVLARTHPSLVGGPSLVHVDAYRLGSALELDDLDIDLEHSVVVVEWGRDMAEHLVERWWEIEIARPRGAGGADSLDAGGAELFDAGGAEPRDAAGADPRDAAELDADQPRHVRITRHP